MLMKLFLFCAHGLNVRKTDVHFEVTFLLKVTQLLKVKLMKKEVHETLE